VVLRDYSYIGGSDMRDGERLKGFSIPTKLVRHLYSSDIRFLPLPSPILNLFSNLGPRKLTGEAFLLIECIFKLETGELASGEKVLESSNALLTEARVLSDGRGVEVLRQYCPRNGCTRRSVALSRAFGIH